MASSPTSSSRRYLLIEEYDALALAIQSALKKFAPAHSPSVASSLAQAREIAFAQRPELAILDFDPPFPGTIAFLERLRDSLPDTRVLVLAPGISREVVAQRGANAGLHFVEKPFDLVEFGAAVQALLAPGSSRGRLRDLSLADVAMLGCVGGLNAIIDVRDPVSGHGTLHLANGRMRHAATGRNDGAKALEEMLAWPHPRFAEEGLPQNGPQSFTPAWAATLLDALRASAAEPASEPSPEKIGRKILLIDDTEMLLIFVEDSLTLADPSFQIFAASSGAKGVEEAKRLRPDLALVDYSIPDMLGDEVCRRLLAAPETSRLPVIMMSGHETEMQRIAPFLPNVVATIAKPFISDALVALVKATLAKDPLPEGLHEMPPLTPVSSEPPRILVPPSEPAAAEKPGAKEMLLDLPLDVVAMRFTPSFQIDSIRARLAAPTVAVQIPTLAARASLPLETGFHLGDVDLDGSGQLALVRLLPTAQPFHAVATNGAYAVDGMAVVPANERERLQLISSGNAAMTMQLFAPLELVSVDLSPALEVRQLVLRCRSNSVRVTLNSDTAQVRNGAIFKTDAIVLDAKRRIQELTLTPAGD